jgi:O-succinylbenzoic acid--CoA ligase
VSGTAEEILGRQREWDAAVDPEPLVVVTSGSTGRPKRVVLSRDAMRASALASQERLGGPGRWVLNLPPTYVAGVQVLYRSVVAGTEPILLRGPLTDVRDELPGDHGPGAARSYISLVPTQLVRILDRDPAGLETLACFSRVLVGGGPLEPAVRRRAEAAGVEVVQTYGMSETCGGCVYDGRPLDGVEVRIVDGQVLLRGAMLFDGYEHDPALTAATLREGWLVTHDRGELDADGRLRITGRADDVINTGGVKVPGPEVARRLAEHPDVRAAEVLGVPDPEWGERVVAFVAAELDLDAVRAWVSARCPREWAPRQVVQVAGLPLLPNGKVDRLTLRALAEDPA